MKFESFSTFITVIAFLAKQQHRPFTPSSMPKRTASLAAAAKKISSKARKVVKETTTTSSITVNDNAPDSKGSKPWYTFFSKSDAQYNNYMKNEWGYEKRGDVALFEKICLEGAQSGLSWLTILRKREAYRKTFYNFDIAKVSKMTAKDVQRILDSNDKEDPTRMVVRHRGKIEATINNAKCIQDMYEEDDRDCKGKKTDLFDSFLWSFVNDKPILNTKWKQGQGVATALSKSPESEAMSKALKKRGFRFVGPTTAYALMQSCGMVVDHPAESPEWEAALSRLKKRAGGYQKDTDVRGNRGDNDDKTKGAGATKKPKATAGVSNRKRAKKA